jgi:hypothetical protein
MKDFKEFISETIAVDVIINMITERGFKKTSKRVKVLNHNPQPQFTETEVLRVDGGAGKSVDFCVIERHDKKTNQSTYIMALNEGRKLIRKIGTIPTVEDAKVWVKANNRIVKNPEYHIKPSTKMVDATERQYNSAKKSVEMVIKDVSESSNLNETVMQIAFRKAIANKK